MNAKRSIHRAEFVRENLCAFERAIHLFDIYVYSLEVFSELPLGALPLALALGLELYLKGKYTQLGQSFAYEARVLLAVERLEHGVGISI